jgi:membrane-associated phospholipid phosphatase
MTVDKALLLAFGVIGIPVAGVVGAYVAARSTGGVPAPLRRLAELIGRIPAYAAIIVVTVLVALLIFTVAGRTLVHHFSSVDVTTFAWVHEHRVHWMSRLMSHVTNWAKLKTHIVDAAIICGVLTAALDLSRPGRRAWFWSGPVQIVVAVFLVWRTQLFLLHHVSRHNLPVHSDLGGYPSGGAQRAIADMGVLLFVTLRRLDLPRWIPNTLWGLWAALAYAEGYSRIYVEKHYLQDALAGWALGALMFIGFLWAGRILDGVPEPSPTTGVPAGRPVARSGATEP